LFPFVFRLRQFDCLRSVVRARTPTSNFEHNFAPQAPLPQAARAAAAATPPFSLPATAGAPAAPKSNSNSKSDSTSESDSAEDAGELLQSFSLFVLHRAGNGFRSTQTIAAPTLVRFDVHARAHKVRCG
jgi:hypothetical protein